MAIGIANIPYLFAGAVFALGGGVLLAASFGWLAGNEEGVVYEVKADVKWL